MPPLKASFIDSDWLLPSTNYTEESNPVIVEMIKGMKVVELKAVYKNNKLGIGSKKKDSQDYLINHLEEREELAMKPITINKEPKKTRYGLL